jgi:hypothetical protein
MSKAPWEKGSKMGMSRYTASREKEDTEAMFEALKKADWMQKMKKRAILASPNVKDLYSPFCTDVRRSDAASLVGPAGSEVMSLKEGWAVLCR